MSLGRQRAKQQVLWVAAQEMVKAPGHPFYRKLNELLREAGFDKYVEGLCAPFYADKLGRPSIPPGVYFRMLFIGYFEGIDSQRGIAWRCADSRSLQAFLGYQATEKTPDHSSLTHTRKRLPLKVHREVFCKLLEIAQTHGLLRGQSIAVDATTLEANAAMKSIVRKETGEDWREYLRRLAEEAGIEDATEEDLRRMDRGRKNKKVSNKDWVSWTDPDSRIAKMKDGRTHLAYKAEHAVDVECDLVVAAQVYAADEGDTETLVDTVVEGQTNIFASGSDVAIRDVVADKGYHSAQTVSDCAEGGVRTYIAEPGARGRRRWTGKPPQWREAVYGNRRRCRGARGKRLQRLRSEMPERSFAHVCETGGARRTWIRGLLEVTKRYMIQVAAHNLGVIMRKLFGVGTPRSLQGRNGMLSRLFCAIGDMIRSFCTAVRVVLALARGPDRRFDISGGSRATVLAAPCAA
jgi:transposase